MKKILLSAALCLLSISRVASGAIVYSGSQNVTLALNPMSPMDSRTIQLGGMSGDWDDFRVELWLEMGMPGEMRMGMATKLAIYAPLGMNMGSAMNMAMGGVLGLRDYALNLSMGGMIGPNSSFLDWAYLCGSGEFGEGGGYVGLRTAMGNFGWVHMRRQSNIGTDMHRVTFDGWAYEDRPGVPIRAGVIWDPTGGSCNDGPALTTRPVCATKCPTTETCCPAMQTKCPEMETRCPPADTRCPPYKTQCPTLNTRCPATQTKCPEMQTRCPQTAFQCKPFGDLPSCPTVDAMYSIVDTGWMWQTTK